MSFIILLAGIILLVLLITWAKLNAFLAFIIVSILIGLFNGMNIENVTIALEKGIGNLLGSLSIILCLGAMLGKLIAESGAAQKITSGLMSAFGRRYLMWALVLTAFIVGIPLFFDVGFVLLVPLIIVFSKQYNISAIYIGSIRHNSKKIYQQTTRYFRCKKFTRRRTAGFIQQHLHYFFTCVADRIKHFLKTCVVAGKYFCQNNYWLGRTTDRHDCCCAVCHLQSWHKKRKINESFDESFGICGK